MTTRHTQNTKKPDVKKPDATALGPLLAVSGGEDLPRFTRGPHKGKSIREISSRQLDSLLSQSYPHASDPEHLLNEYLTRMLGKPVTAKTALSAMREDWRKTREKLDALEQSSLSARLWGIMSEGLQEIADEPGKSDLS